MDSYLERKTVWTRTFRDVLLGACIAFEYLGWEVYPGQLLNDGEGKAWTQRGAKQHIMRAWRDNVKDGFIEPLSRVIHQHYHKGTVQLYKVTDRGKTHFASFLLENQGLGRPELLGGHRIFISSSPAGP